MPSQSPKPELQLIEQLPDAQLAWPFSELHAFRHIPQLATLARSASQPLPGSPSQSALFVGQVSALHSPPPQARPAAQVELQAPQFFASVASLASQPLLALPSQSAVPVAQAPLASGLSVTV